MEKLLFLSFLIFTLYSQDAVEVSLPEEKWDGVICDSPDSSTIVVGLIALENAGSSSDSFCGELVDSVSAGSTTPISLDEYKNCLSQPAIEYEDYASIECRLSEYTPYYVNEIGMWANGIDLLEDETAPQYVVQETSDIDLSNWEGVSGNLIGQGQKLRKTFVIDPNGASVVYARVSFTPTATDANNWGEDDYVAVTFGAPSSYIVYYQNIDYDEVHQAIVLLQEPYVNYNDDGTMNVTIGFKLYSGSDNLSYSLEVHNVGVYSREEIATFCRDEEPNVGTEFYPEFIQSDSGFQFMHKNDPTAERELVHFEVAVPRYYYNFTIDFEQGNGDAKFMEGQTYSADAKGDDSLTYWYIEGEPDSPCGDERFVANIPWSVLNTGGAGDFAQLQTFQTDYYSFDAYFNYTDEGETSDNVRLALEAAILNLLSDENTHEMYYDLSIAMNNDGNETSELTFGSSLAADVDTVRAYIENNEMQTDFDIIPVRVTVDYIETSETVSTLETFEETDDEYYFGAVVEIIGSEMVYTEGYDDTGAYREWLTTRDLEWRVPYTIQMQRIVLASTSIESPPSTDGIIHVSAMTEYVQANTVYNPDINGGELTATVDIDFHTITMYPYLFVTGTVADDPPYYFENSSSNSNQTYDAPLDGDLWSPPSIKHTPFANFSETVEVSATVSFVGEATENCTFVDAGDITINNGKSCDQYWHISIEPVGASCYVDGVYEVEFGARCFYDKPTCLYHYQGDDIDGNAMYETSVTIYLEVESTNMCPELVHEVDLYGKMCDTGRDEYMLCDDVAIAYPCDGTTDCVGPPHPSINGYFQGEDVVHFFIELDSTDARVIYSEISDIMLEQENGNSISLFSSGVANDVTVDGVTVDPVILETLNSNQLTSYGADQGTGDLEFGNYAAWKVFLDPVVFPVEVDGHIDATFVVTVFVWYEGWGEDKPDSRRLILRSLNVQQEYDQNFQGKTEQNLDHTIPVTRSNIDTVPCFEQENMVWVISLDTESSNTDLSQELQSLLESNSFSMVDTHDIQGLRRVVVQTHNSDLWATMEMLLLTRPATWYDTEYRNTEAVTCMDIPEGVASVSAIDAIECALGQPCSFYGQQTLIEHIHGSDSSLELTPEDGASNLTTFLMTLVFLFLL